MRIRPDQNLDVEPGGKYTVPSLNDLAAQFHFSPSPDKTERKDLGVDWNAIKAGIITEHAAGCLKYPALTRENTTCAQSSCTDHDAGLAHKITLAENVVPTPSGRNLFVRSLKTAGNLGISFLDLVIAPEECLRADPDTILRNLVGMLSLYQEDDFWDLQHREVKSEYREQGIGSFMIDVVESNIAAIKQATGKQQTISVDVGQLDVILWLLKRGYAPADARSHQRLGLITKADSSLRIIQKWYICKKDHPAVTDPEAHFEPDEDAYRVTLIKRI